MGVQEYLKELGRQEIKVLVIKNLLADQYAIAKIADLAGVSQAFVRRTKKGAKVE